VESFRSDWTRCHDTWQDGRMRSLAFAFLVAAVVLLLPGGVHFLGVAVSGGR
jgi:hypothetical protein